MSARRLSVLALLAMGACAGSGHSAEPLNATWHDLATAPRQSPAIAAAGDLTLGWTGVDGKPLSIVVARPHNPDRKVVNVSAGADGAAIAQAIGQLKAAGGGTLRLAPGTYTLANDNDQPALTLDGLNDVLIDGTGARFVFANWGKGIAIRNSKRLTITGLSVGYAKPAVLMATVHRDGAQTRLDFGARTLPPGASLHQVSRLDAGADRYAGGASRFLLGQNGVSGTPAGGNSLSVGDPQLAKLNDGDKVAVKLSYYQGSAIEVYDPGNSPQSTDLVFDHIAIRDSAGAGLVISRMGRGLAVVDSTFGDVGAGAATIAYDALHITAAGGDILIRHNQFSRSGDDAINVASPIFKASVGADGQTAQIAAKGGGVPKGGAVAFFDANLGFVGAGHVADRSPPSPDGKATVQLDTKIAAPDSVSYARDLGLIGPRYAIVDNVIGHCECHGILAQNPDGLVRGNQIHDTRFNAIRVVTSAQWDEGAGAQNLIVENNDIAGTGDDGRRGVVWAAIAVYGELPGNPPVVTSQPIHADIAIRNNRIANVAEGCVSISSAQNVTAEPNSCTNFDHGVDRARLMADAGSALDGAARLKAKTAYMMRSDGVWVDPVSTAAIKTR